MTNPDIRLPDYAQTLSISVHGWEDGLPVLVMAYSEDLCGHPGLFHGGAISALLEIAAVTTLDVQLRAGGSAARVAPLNTTVQFLRAAGAEPLFAAATVVKSGRRLANLAVTLWQGASRKPVATGVVNVTIEAPT